MRTDVRYRNRGAVPAVQTDPFDGDAAEKMDVLTRQRIDPNAPPHPFTQSGRSTFDALLQSRPDLFAGDVLVSDSTLWSSTNGGVDSLRRLWTNVIGRVT